MKPNEQKKAAKAFIDRWKAAEGNEQREANSFWIELCSQVLGIANPTQHLDFERKVKGRRIDVFYEDRSILIENKSRGVSLDEPEQRGKDKYGNPRMVTPYEQARWYADTIVPRSIAPRWILTCNFDEIRIYDLDDEYAEDHYETLLLDELPEQIHRLSFFTRKENSRLEREKELSVAAGEVVGKLYDEFSKAYVDIENDKAEQRSLNVLITRIVFLLYAEDADLLQERNAFYKYLKNFQTAHMRTALIELFEALRTPKEERSAYMDPAAAAFPYVNGGLFADQIIIPQFTENARFLLLQEASAEFDWAGISPTIFGAVFESTLNPETRRSGGMHYTSIENIHKLTGPLFYDALKDELTRIEGAATEKERKFKLRAFREKLASLKFLDSAAGSGNFLTETYLSLRKLENRVLEDLYGGQMIMGEMDPIQVQVDQFYGIEINDFAVEVAKTALWIAELQMLDQTREILSMWIDPLPLKTNDNIVCANALRMDWNDVLPAIDCNYVIGNPPFVSQDGKDDDQKRDMEIVWGDANDGYLDYVTAWYKKAADYFGEKEDGSFTFVSTNSICQGQPVAAMFKPLFNAGWRISLAWPTFVWKSEALDKANVHVVIVGMDRKAGEALLCTEDVTHSVKNINPYLAAAPNFFIDKLMKPLSPNMPEVVIGYKPADNGFLQIKSREEYDKAMSDPIASQYVRKCIGATELINGKDRWCLWLREATEADLYESPFIRNRIEQCREWRTAQSKTGDAYKFKDIPHLFKPNKKERPSGNFICIPRHFSGGREYFTVDWLEEGTIITDACFAAADDDGLLFGIVSSSTFMLWQNTVGGRLKSDCRFANTLVWNTFPLPDLNDEQRGAIVEAGRGVLEARRSYEGQSLADLYKPDGFASYDRLVAAHNDLNVAVYRALGLSDEPEEGEVSARLVELYAEKSEGK